MDSSLSPSETNKKNFISSSVLFSLESEIKYNIFLIQWEIKIQRENISKN